MKGPNQVTFNTGRHYGPNGQEITATYYGNGYKDMLDFWEKVDEDSDPANDPYVIFEDHTRGIKGRINLCGLGQDDIMKAYDTGNYTPC